MICKVCNKEIKEYYLNDVLGIKKHTICYKCFSELPLIYEFSKIHEYKCLSLYAYKDKIKELIYQLKGLKDIELKDVFLEFFLDELNIITGRVMWKLVFPLILILIGVTIILSFFRGGPKKNIEDVEYTKSKSYKYESTKYPRYTAILGGGDYKNNSNDLKGIVAEAILGGLEIDLRDAKINEDIVLELTAVLGGIDIFIPDNVSVEIISGNPILGGFEHKINKNVIGGPKVRIKYIAVLGGIEVK